MENSSKPVFDDPALKTAISRSCSKCTCPLHLRHRIGELLGRTGEKGEPLSDTAPMSSIRWRWTPVYSGIALAAALLIVVGIVSLVLSRSSQALPSALQAAVIDRHDQCASHSTHVGPDVPQDFALLGPYLTQQLSHAVLAVNLDNDHWHFRGAAICPVGNVKAAHLVFDQNNRTLSILSLPASSYPDLQNHKMYEGTSTDHAVIAKREDGAIFCLVSSDPSNQTSVEDLSNLLRAHEHEAVSITPPSKHIFLTWVGQEGPLRP